MQNSHQKLLCDDTSAAKQQAEFLQAQLKEHLGVTLNIRQVTYNARLDAMDQGDFEIVFAGWSPDYNDPMTYLDMWVLEMVTTMVNGLMLNMIRLSKKLLKLLIKSILC